MPEIEIKRVRYFDRQFLKQAEFREEQLYHMHMRRRLNYILFEQSGVVLVNGTELTIQTNHLTPANKNFTVTAGLAISKDSEMMEGKEIILRESSTKNLDDYGILAGQTAYITVHYQEEETNIPPSEGEVDEPTRVKENAVITAHSTDPTGGSADNDEEYIVLGTIIYNTMVSNNDADDTGRQLATLNHHLGGVASPTLLSIEIDPNTITLVVGQSITLDVIGHLSGGGTQTLAPEGLTWTGGTSAVSVDNGVVTGHEVTTTPVVITASTNGHSASTSVTVIDETVTVLSIDGISMDPPTVTEGGTVTFTAMGTLSDAPSTSIELTAEHGLVWSSDPPGVLSFVGTTGEANVTGSDTVTVTATVGDLDESITFYVNPAVPAPVINTKDGFNPKHGRPGKEVKIFGSNFNVDFPDPPTVVLVPQGPLDPPIDPIEVEPASFSEGEIAFDLPGIPGRTSPVDMLIQVHTSAVEHAESSEKFRWNPPLTT